MATYGQISDSVHRSAQDSIENISAANNHVKEAYTDRKDKYKAAKEAKNAAKEANKQVKAAEQELNTLRQGAADPKDIEAAEDKLSQAQEAQTRAADSYTQAKNDFKDASGNWLSNREQRTDTVVDATGIRDAEVQPLSQTFRRDIAAAVKGQATGNQADVEAKTAKAQAQDYRNEAANRNMEAQQSQQIANQNAYSEAGKIASVQNDAENRQNINNTSFAAGTASARLRKTNAPDVQSQLNRQDQQRQVAAERREAADVAQFQADAKEGKADSAKVKSRDVNDALNTSSSLARGEGETENTETENTETENTETENTETENTETENTEQPQDQPPESSGTSWQNVMNYLTYGNDPTSGWNKGTKPGYQEAKAYAEQKGWSPIQASQSEFDGDLGHLQEMVKAQQPGFYEEWQSGSGRVGEGGKQINRGDQGDEVIDSAQVSSDERIKNLKSVVSDMNMKWIKEDWDKYGSISPSQLALLLKHAGKFSLNDREYGLDDEDDWENNSDVTKAYADHIRNYVYNYKPEAQEIDPRNDPSVEHIGPMAQDIEQVNPAVVHENDQGIKSVDTSRLAMMNAGAIGDLARMLRDIDDRLKKAGI